MKSTGNKKPLGILADTGAFNCRNQRKSNMSNLTQNFANPNNQPLVIGEFTIRQDDQGRYCLNDLHKASGGENKHAPYRFIRLDQTMDLIHEIEQAPDMVLAQKAVNSVHGGNDRGTYVVEDLVYSYAMWISAKFHLIVIRAYKMLVTQWKINDRQSISPEQQALLHEIVDRRSQGNRKIYAEMWSRHNRHFKIPRYAELLAIHFPESLHYLETMELKAKAERIENSELKALKLLEVSTTNKVMDYFHALHDEIRRLGGISPKYPDFDKEAIVGAVVTRMVDSSRMLLTIGMSGKPNISFVPNNAWILSDENLVGIIADPCGVKKDLLPDVIKAAATRLSK